MRIDEVVNVANMSEEDFQSTFRPLQMGEKIEMGDVTFSSTGKATTSSTSVGDRFQPGSMKQLWRLRGISI